MSVLITDSINVLQTRLTNFKVCNLITTYISKDSIEELKQTHNQAFRRGTLRFKDCSFDNIELYPSKFESYEIIVEATPQNSNVFKVVSTVINMKNVINKPVKISILSWDNIVTRKAKFERPSAYATLISKNELKNSDISDDQGITKIIQF